MELILFAGSLVAGGHVLLSGLPMRYAAGSGAAGLDSDGLAAWRILTGGVGRQPALTYGRDVQGDPSMRLGFVLVLGVVAILAFAVDVRLGLFLAGVLVLAWILQRFDERAGR